MLLVANIVLVTVALVLSVPVAMFCLEVGLSLWPQRKVDFAPTVPDSRIAVLIPAHNEQAVLAATLRTLLPTVPPGTHVLVVADNCDDKTAVIARECGAESVERIDVERRGKGFALDFGIRRLSLDPPDVVVFLDADCHVETDTVKLLAASAIATQRPVQGLNLCDPDLNGSASQAISGLAFRFKNLVRTLGLVRLAGGSHLTGTGMALPWSLLVQGKLAGGNLVEDMQLGIDMTLTGSAPLFLPEARVSSPLPHSSAAARTQRTRWEHGHLQTLLRHVPRLVWLAVAHRRLKLFWLALDLAIPPLSLLVLALMATTAAAAAGWIAGASALPFSFLVIADLLVALTVLVGWAIHCRHQVRLQTLLAAPLYAAAKLPIYLAFLAKRQRQWVRTSRDVVRR
jgi:cellulose synthase/poly-beta-1,6-N-acetylglucosamine synthase-like glycosyltransferase